MALLGEMYFHPGSGSDGESGYEIPREGGIAYAAQESWVLNDTIRVCGFHLMVFHGLIWGY